MSIIHSSLPNTYACNHHTNEKERRCQDAVQLQSDHHFFLIDGVSYFQSVVCLPGVCFYGTVRATVIYFNLLSIFINYCGAPGLEYLMR